MHRYKDIKIFFKEKLSHIKINKALIKHLRIFRYEWSTKSDEYMDFLGSNLAGVHYIRFSTLDDDELMTEVLKIDNYKQLQKDIYLVDDMKKKYKIGSNIIYQTLMYISREILLSKDLSKEDKRDGIRECCLLMQYRMFTSLYSRYFPYPVPEVVATTVYNKLSHKFLIKQLDSWQDMFEYRVNVCLDKHSVNHQQMKTFTTKESIDLLSAIQTKLRGNIKEIWSVLADVIENDDIMQIDSATYTGGEHNLEQVSEVTTGTGIYISRVKTIATQPHDFIDMETLKIVSSMFNNVEFELIQKFITCMTDDKFNDYNELNNIIENSLLISFNYLQRMDINIEKREYIPKALILIRFFWASSKVKNEDMIDIKEKLYKKAKDCTHRKTNWILITLSLSYIVYIFLRSLKK